MWELEEGPFQPAWLRPTPVEWGERYVLQDPDLGQGSGATLPAPSLLSAQELGQGSGYSESFTPVLRVLFFYSVPYGTTWQTDGGGIEFI